MSLAIRPMRVVTLVPTLKGVAWERSFEIAIATHTGAWGGRANIVLPYDTSTLKSDLFWALLRAYDPDVVLEQRWIVEDAATLLSRSWMRDWEADRRAWAKKHDVDPDDLLRDGLKGGLEFNEPTPANDSPLCDELVRRVGPLDLHLGEPVTSITSAAGVSWPATRPPAVDLSGQSLLAAGDVGHLALRLLATTELGRLTADSAELAEEAGASVEELNGASWALCEKLIRQDWRRPTAWTLADVGLADYFSGLPTRSQTAVVVVGNTAWDFALFYALRRMGVPCWYLSSRLRSTKHYMSALISGCTRTRGRQGVAVVSATSPRFADKVASELIVAKYGPGGSGPIEVVPWWKVIPDAPARAFERDMEGWLESNLALRDGRSVRVPTPLSRIQEETGDRRFSWMIDVASSEWAPIAHPSLAPLVSGPGELTNQARTGPAGLSYYAHRMLRAGGQSAQAELYRPHLHPKSLYDQIRDALSARGWQCHLSEKGAFSEALARLFGGDAALIEALQDTRIRALLKCYRAPREKTQRKRFAGAWLSDGSRRVLTADEISTVIGEQAHDGFLDDLVERGVLNRGVVLKCARCRQASWYRLREFDKSIPCRRCESAIPFLDSRRIDRQAIEWRYKLAEAAYHFAINNGVEPVLAVAALVDPRERRPIQVCHELIVQQPGTTKTFEVDLFVSIGSDLWIGEANSTGRFEDKQSGRLAYLGQALNTNRFVFATSAAALNEKSLERIQASLKPPRFELRTIEGLPGLK